MRIRVRHETAYTFETQAKSVLQVLRLTPRAFDGQHVASWRIDVDMDCRLSPSDDAFGNITHIFSAEGPIDRFRVLVEGEVETTDTAGVVRGSRELFPPELFLRSTDLTHADAAVVAFAREATTQPADLLSKLHALLGACNEAVSFDPALDDASAAEALEAGKANGDGHAHLFIAGARAIGIPARFVSGYLLREEPAGPESLHVWAEAHVEGLGWVGFDPAHGLCPSDRHIRIANALDRLGACPVRSAHTGSGAAHKTDVRVVQSQAQRQWQS